MSKSTFFHITLSPKILPDPKPLLGLIHDKAKSWVLSHELGDTGHPHLELYAELVFPVRSDSLRRSILNLYPSIPQPERRNIKVCVNHIDPDPRYGFGYSLKEGDIISTNLSPDYQDQCLEYYYARKDQVKSQIQSNTPTSKAKKLSVDQVAELYAEYVDNTVAQKSSELLFSQFVTSLCTPGNIRISYTTYAKLKYDILLPYIESILLAKHQQEFS